VILINLLPHREEKRRQRKRAFFAALAGSAVVGVLVAGVWFAVLQQLTAAQQARNDFLKAEIARAGKRICSFHVSDWLADTQDLRLDRGMMGDGVIDLPALRGMVEAAGYDGYVEIEIFSQRNWWQRDADEVIGVIKDRVQTAV